MLYTGRTQAQGCNEGESELGTIVIEKRVSCPKRDWLKKRVSPVRKGDGLWAWKQHKAICSFINKGARLKRKKGIFDISLGAHDKCEKNRQNTKIGTYIFTGHQSPYTMP